MVDGTERLVRFRTVMTRSDVLAGVRDITPALPTSAAFGMLFGAAAVEVGFTPVQATAMSLFIFAGTAQMATIELLRADVLLVVVFATVLVLNLRYVIYSASLAPRVRNLPTRWRAVMGYALFDINYALVATRFETEDAESGGAEDAVSETGGVGHEGWYYLAATLPVVGAFTLGTLAGALAGASIGDGLSLEFAIPLIFISLLVPMIDGRVDGGAAVVTGVVATVAAGLPFNSGFLLAIVLGVAVGTTADCHGLVPNGGLRR